MDPILVVGGGAAGMIAAWRAAALGARVVLLERNARLGIKLHISGGGKCNITHDGDMEAVRAAFVPHEARFLRPGFMAFTNRDVLGLLEPYRVETYTRPDGRIFPVSGRAEDVVDALEGTARAAGAEIRCGACVERIETRGGRVRGVVVNGRRLPGSAVILAVGGSSYPKTGTVGDGFRWARELGHTIVPLRAALAPLYLDPVPPPEWNGVAFRDCVLRARQVRPDRFTAENAEGAERRRGGGGAGKVIARWRGDLLFTFKGISGPTALGVSRDVALAMEQSSVTVDADLLPDRQPAEITEQLLDPEHRRRRLGVRSLLDAWLPNRIVPSLMERAGIPAGMSLAQLPRRERNVLVDLLKVYPLGAVRAVPLERGEVTAGGVALEEVDPHTMASRKVAGLYLCGEILDIAGPVGGYNLQAAFSTGYLAGEATASGIRSVKVEG